MSAESMAQSRALVKASNVKIQFSHFDSDTGTPAAMDDWLVDWQERVGTIEWGLELVVLEMVCCFKMLNVFV